MEKCIKCGAETNLLICGLVCSDYWIGKGKLQTK